MNEILILLKALTNTTESDSSLSKLVVIAALIAQREMEFSPEYTISITNSTITPNPIDNAFILIVAYKASILLLHVKSLIKSSTISHSASSPIRDRRINSPSRFSALGLRSTGCCHFSK